MGLEIGDMGAGVAYFHTLLTTIAVALMLYGAWSDARTLRIPNWLTLALLALFFPTALVAGIGMEAIAWHIVAGLGVLIFCFVLFALGLFGGGDAKLASACALWLGVGQLAHFAIWVVIVGGILSVVVILLRKGLGLWPDWLVHLARGLFEPGKAVPYGIAIVAGALVQMPLSPLFPPSWGEVLQFVIG